MLENLGAAMRRALGATRASDLAEATRIIQSALGGKADRTEAPHAKDNVKRLPNTQEKATATARRGLGETLNALRKGSSAEWLRPVRQPHLPNGAAFLRKTITTSSGHRDYRLYIPSSNAPRGLVVMLHGCKQNAEDFATGTTMNLVAESEHLLVAYPTQPNVANTSGCWNWFRPEDQRRAQGEPHILAEMTASIVAEFGLNSSQVFVAGLSAGGAMAAVMAATYPELYAAVGVHSGLPFRCAQDVNSALAAMRGDLSIQRHSRPSSLAAPRQIVFHGSRDHTVVPANARALMEDARLAHGAADRIERQFISGAKAVEHTQIVGRDGVSLAESWLISGAGHYWSGGDPAGSHAKAEGPNASQEMIRFFLKRPLQA